jgi:hypothetical protein
LCEHASQGVMRKPNSVTSSSIIVHTDIEMSTHGAQRLQCI